eukprot:3413425-Pyramimonas_sp.AAC.1
MDSQGRGETARRWHRYFPQLHERIQREVGATRRAERRDEGFTRESRPDRRSGVDFGRERAAAIDAAAAASPSNRASLLAEAAPGLAAAQEAARASVADPVREVAAVVAPVPKWEARTRERNLGGAKAAAEA